MISSHLLFFVSALGAVNGIFLALYLFGRRPQRLADGVLGTLLLAISIRTGKSAFYYFNPDLAVEFLQFGLSACLLIGPLTYLYVHSFLADTMQRPVDSRWRRHLALSAILIGAGLIFPYSRFPASWYYVICGIHAYWFIYLLLAGRELWQARAVLITQEKRMSRATMLLLSVYLSSLLILVAYVLTPMTSYIVGALSFTFSVHVTVLLFLLKNNDKEDIAKKEKYQNRKLAETEARAILESLHQVMREQQLYLNPALNLALLSRKVGSLQTTVSQVINEYVGKSFNIYINEFRIEHAKTLLSTESHLNMELVAERSGFNSTSTFFAAFKKIAGQTPASYRALAVPSLPA